MPLLRYLIVVSILLVFAGPAFAQQTPPAEMPNLLEDEEDDTIPPSVLVAIEDGELVMYEVGPDNFMDEIEQDTQVFFGLGRSIRNFVGRQLSPEEMAAKLEELRTFANERALEMALSLCDVQERPETVGASAGFTMGVSVNFSASWIVKDVCPD